MSARPVTPAGPPCPACATYPAAVTEAIDQAGREHVAVMLRLREIEEKRQTGIPLTKVDYDLLPRTVGNPYHMEGGEA